MHRHRLLFCFVPICLAYACRAEQAPLDFILNTREHCVKYSNRTEFDVAFRPDRPIKIIINGWTSNVNVRAVPLLRNAYLSNIDCNVIAVVWPNNRTYISTVWHANASGRQIALMIDELHQRLGAPMASFHVIGHSLGAHVAGAVGAACRHRLPRITGLDPAAPWFLKLCTPRSWRLDASDADFVDVIHTSAGVALLLPIGHVDFYPNGGLPPQPGTKFDADAWQSHFRAVQLFAESIDPVHQFWGRACRSYQAYRLGRCAGSARVRMGEQATPGEGGGGKVGKVFLRTAGERPYALTDDVVVFE